MRRLTMLILGSVVALAGTGCGSSGSDNADPAYYSGQSTAPSGATDSEARQQDNLHLTIGDEADMTGKDPGRGLQITAFEVTPTKLLSPTKVPAGSQVIAVQFAVVNSGTSVYNNSPAAGATLIDGSGHSYAPVAGPVKLQSGDAFKTPLKLAPQGRTTGYVAFAVPTGVTIKKVRFGIDGGSGDTAMWRVV